MGCSVSCDVCYPVDGLQEDEIEAALNRGLERMDLFVPGWWQNVDLGTFDMSDTTACVAGQGIPGGWYARQDVLNYEELYEELDIDQTVDIDVHLGFDPWPFARELEELWRAVILERQEQVAPA